MAEAPYLCAAADAASKLCSGDAGKSVQQVVEGTARSVAHAVAKSTIQTGQQCQPIPADQPEVYAKATADIWAQQYLEAFDNAVDCSKCADYTTSVGYLWRWVFFDAVTKAEPKVHSQLWYIFTGSECWPNMMRYQQSWHVQCTARVDA